MKTNRSLARIKFYACHLFSTLCIILIMISDVGSTWTNLFFLGAFLSAPLILMIKCEGCGGLVYRKGKEGFGYVDADYFIQPEKCPRCGLERV
jgi:hypothetical protein